MKTPAGHTMRIRMCGDPALVEEYTARCEAHGLIVEQANRSGNGSRKKAKGVNVVDLALELTNLSAGTKRRNLAMLDAALPSSVTIISSSVTHTVAEQASWIRHPARLVGVGALPSLLEEGLMEFAALPSTTQTARSAAAAFARSLEKEHAFVRDGLGMVLPRILCMIANEACFALEEQVASPADIDTAMKLGMNHPRGPLEWLQRIGAEQVRAVLAALEKAEGGERYRAAPRLHDTASSGH